MDPMKVLRRKRRMIGLPLLVLLLSSAGVFYGGMWISEKRAQLFRPARCRKGFHAAGTPCRITGTAYSRPGRPRREARPDSRYVDEALRTAEIHIRESKMLRKRPRNDQ